MSAAVPADATGDVPVKSPKKKLILLIAIALVVVLAGGGAAVFVLKKRAAAAAAAEEAGDAAGHGPEAQKAESRHAPTYVPLEPFVVNLADKDAERYAQIGLTLEVDDPKFAEEMKLYMPAIRNAILMILAHKNAAELLERSGKQALATEIMREAVRPMGIEIDAEPAPAEAAASGAVKLRKPVAHNPVRRVHFASFIIQ